MSSSSKVLLDLHEYTLLAKYELVFWLYFNQKVVKTWQVGRAQAVLITIVFLDYFPQQSLAEIENDPFCFDVF